jgi:hypothetical protein
VLYWIGCWVYDLQRGSDELRMIVAKDESPAVGLVIDNCLLRIRGEPTELDREVASWEIYTS